jgi:arylsulfatase A-like enzyme
MSDSRQRWSGLALAEGLALAFFAACLWWVVREVEIVLANDRIMSSLSVERALGSALGRQLAAFAAAALLVHLVFGCLVFGLARLTEAAFPRGAGARRGWLVAGWFVGLAGLAMAANTTLFPSSVFAGTESWWRGRMVGLPPALIAAGTLGGVVLLLAWRAAPRWPRQWRWSLGPASAVVAAVAVFVVLWPPRIPAVAPTAVHARPNVVILGVDSLRNDLMIPRRGPAEVPNIRAFLREARRFEDATTPLARTYASWLSILSGRHPVTTNARYNLMPRALVREGETLGDALRAQGYLATYATDEVRFANIDASFGFDRVITPPVGAVDFLLGRGGDLPLVNLVASTPAGRQLFPSNHANRAAQVTYRTRDFVRRLEREIDAGGPSFLAIHLTLAHWPYSWAGRPTPSVPEAYRDAYGEAVREVDRQFGEVMRVLADKGVLDNAIVVLLSDHGEALGADDDSIIRKTGTSREIWDSLWGHGTSVLSPNQYRVLLAMRAYGRARLPGPARDYDWPVSLEDLRPTLQELATGVSPAGVDGVSLAPYMAEPARAMTLADRIRFTETDFNTASIMAGRYDASGIVNEVAVFYELDPDSGWVQLRAPRLPELIAQKQRAALSANALLAAIPGSGGREARYLYADRRSPLPRPLGSPGMPFDDPEAKRLREALHARFPGELAPAREPPRM